MNCLVGWFVGWVVEIFIHWILKQSRTLFIMYYTRSHKDVLICVCLKTVYIEMLGLLLPHSNQTNQFYGLTLELTTLIQNNLRTENQHHPNQKQTKWNWLPFECFNFRNVLKCWLIPKSQKFVLKVCGARAWAWTRIKKPKCMPTTISAANPKHNP